MADPNDQQRRYREFLDLLPLTVAIAGLPESEKGKLLNEDQMEFRVSTLKTAYRMARRFAKEAIAGQ